MEWFEITEQDHRDAYGPRPTRRFRTLEEAQKAADRLATFDMLDMWTNKGKPVKRTSDDGFFSTLESLEEYLGWRVPLPE